jgi:AP-3 complex subunit beta
MHPSHYAVAADWNLVTARDLTLEAARDASNARRSSTQMLPSGQLKKLLDSRSERDVLEGLRRVVTVHQGPKSNSTDG